MSATAFLQQTLGQMAELCQGNLDRVVALFKPMELSKGQLFTNFGQQEKRIGFVLDGVLRAYVINVNGKTYNKTLFATGDIFCAYSSLVTQRPSLVAIEALTPVYCLVANYEQLEVLANTNIEVTNLLRRWAEWLFVYKEERELQLVQLNAEQRYALFQKEYEGVEQLIPQYHIASYLGVTPTQLSRIRAKRGL